MRLALLGMLFYVGPTWAHDKASLANCGAQLKRLATHFVDRFFPTRALSGAGLDQSLDRLRVLSAPAKKRLVQVSIEGLLVPDRGSYALPPSSRVLAVLEEWPEWNGGAFDADWLLEVMEPWFEKLERGGEDRPHVARLIQLAMVGAEGGRGARPASGETGWQERLAALASRHPTDYARAVFSRLGHALRIQDSVLVDERVGRVLEEIGPSHYLRLFAWLELVWNDPGLVRLRTDKVRIFRALLEGELRHRLSGASLQRWEQAREALRLQLLRGPWEAFWQLDGYTTALLDTSDQGLSYLCTLTPQEGVLSLFYMYTQEGFRRQGLSTALLALTMVADPTRHAVAFSLGETNKGVFESLAAGCAPGDASCLDAALRATPLYHALARLGFCRVISRHVQAGLLPSFVLRWDPSCK